MQDITLSIVMPVYNEVNTVLEMLRLIQKEKHKKEIIIVDDASSDGTKEMLSRINDANCKVLFNETNKGKGFCVRRGIQEATGDILIIQDADLEYYPDEYTVLIEKIVQGKADVVYGSRFLGAHRVFNYYHYLGNSVINTIANIMLNTNLTDLMTCYKAFRAPVAKELVLRADRFGIETEITAEVFKRGYRVYEVPISYNGRTYDEGKKIHWTDFFKCLYSLLITCARGIDVGKDTLLRMRLMKNNNIWTYNKIKPFLGSKILELGSGLGTFSRFLVAKGRIVSLTDIDPRYIEYLNGRFIGNPSVKVVYADAADIDTVFEKEKFDTVVAINILEHIENDGVALEKMHTVLAPQGRLILLVPSHSILYGRFDKTLQHYRRYVKKGLTKLVQSKGFAVESMRHMNFLGAIGWFVNFIILKRKRMPKTITKLFDKVIPAVACIERVVQFPFGLSLVCIARKQEKNVT